MESKLSADFRSPINTKAVKDYKEVVKKPMDLGTVKKIYKQRSTRLLKLALMIYFWYGRIAKSIMENLLISVK